MSAIISECGLYRYRLEREGRGLGSTAVIMVNPSTADAEQDDATIRKLRGFGDRNQWGRIIVGNLFAYRATDVRDLRRPADPVGPLNDHHLNVIFNRADRVVFAWGPVTKQPALVRGRWRHVDRMARSLGHRPLCIGAPAKCGHPRHPLMLAYGEPIQPWGMDAPVASPMYEADDRGLFCRHCGRTTVLHRLVRGSGYACYPATASGVPERENL